MSYSIYETYTDIDMDDPYISGYNYIIIDAVNNDINIDLYDTVWDGLTIVFVRVDNTSHVVTLTASSGTTINQNSSITLGANYVECVMINNDWHAPKIAVTF